MVLSHSCPWTILVVTSTCLCMHVHYSECLQLCEGAPTSLQPTFHLCVVLTDVSSCRKYSIPCKGRAVQPPLSLTHNVVYFGGTPVNSASTARTNLIHKQLKHTRGGAMKFEFCLPSSCPVTVSPRTGILAEGQVGTTPHTCS